MPPSSVTSPALEPPDEPLLAVDPEAFESPLAPLSKPPIEPTDAPEEQDARRHAANIGVKRTTEGPSVMTRVSDKLRGLAPLKGGASPSKRAQRRKSPQGRGAHART